MLDADRSGKLNFEEFKKLWGSLHNWKVGICTDFLKFILYNADPQYACPLKIVVMIIFFHQFFCYFIDNIYSSRI